MDEQIKEATRKMNEISETGNHDAGKLLEEKFLAERKVKVPTNCIQGNVI